MTVLILTSPEDVTADLVVAALHDRGTPVVRLDPADLPGEVSMSAEYVRGDVHGYLSVQERMVSMDSVRSIWIRRPGTPGAGTAEQSEWLTAEAGAALYGALRCVRARWMNHPAAAAQARYKPWQLFTAHHSGFAVPATLITTFPQAAREFAEQHPQLVVKSVSGTHPGDPPMALPTTLVAPDADFSAVAAGPTLLQQYIPKAADIRLTCVGTGLFAARKKSGPGQVDGRFGSPEDADWEPVEPPVRIARSVREYMAAAGLAYGAFDFAEDTDGTWWFLECNQGGQFGFVELATGQPITAAIADWLAGCQDSRTPHGEP
ncbi:ATP-grasp ribosomal peptide maturase [Actinacidiphila glaucinigra]|uniref:ATP-grasp ribosomal peptide maturase n=1 Tax=Actinacidiphila glaucinigra TaxID=235986 RepID=UPI0033B12093